MGVRKIVWLMVNAMLLVARAYVPARADYTFTLEEAIDALDERDRAIENATVEFRRSIYLAPKENEETLTQVVDDQGKVVREFRTNTSQPAQRFLSRHVLTVVGNDLVRLDNYELKKDPETGEDFRHWSTTVDWGDERRMTPDDPAQIISVYGGFPDRRGLEIIGNEHALLTGIREILRRNQNLRLSDILEVDSAELDGETLLRLRTKPNERAGIAETEMLIDPSKSFVVRRASHWQPSERNKYRHEVTHYDDVVKGDDGLWYATRVKSESYRYVGQSSEAQLVKREEATITSLETNVTDVNAGELFARTLPVGRTVMDYRVNPKAPITYHTSVQDPEMAVFEGAYRMERADADSAVLGEEDAPSVLDSDKPDRKNRGSGSAPVGLLGDRGRPQASWWILWSAAAAFIVGVAVVAWRPWKSVSPRYSSQEPQNSRPNPKGLSRL